MGVERADFRLGVSERTRSEPCFSRPAHARIPALLEKELLGIPKIASKTVVAHRDDQAKLCVEAHSSPRERL